MKSTFLSYFLILAILIGSITGNPINATYDQRQNGKVNVHISIKDVAIILQSDSALGGDDDINYEDYADYDYDHLTVKPNGIWATLGATTAAPAAVIPPANPPPTPAAALSPGFMPPAATAAAQNVSLEGGEDSTGEVEQTVPFVQYPIPADFKPQETPQAMETISEMSHPFPETTSTDPTGVNTVPLTDSTIIKITTRKPLNRTTHKYAWNGDLEEIPVEVIIEPVLKNKQRQHVVPGMARNKPVRRQGGEGRNRSTSKFGM